MANKRDDEQKDRSTKAVSRRDFVKTGAAAGVGVAAGVGGSALSSSGNALSQVSPVEAIQWHYEADVVIIGAGCTGLPAAIRARDLGASVIVVDQNFDIGGKMLHSGGQISLGGGDPLQLRDIAGETDREGFVTAPRQHTVEELTEEAKVSVRNIRRDGNKAAEQGEKDKDLTEDDRDKVKDEIQELTKKDENRAAELAKAKEAEVMET